MAEFTARIPFVRYADRYVKESSELTRLSAGTVRDKRSENPMARRKALAMPYKDQQILVLCMESPDAPGFWDKAWEDRTFTLRGSFQFSSLKSDNSVLGYLWPGKPGLGLKDGFEMKVELALDE